LELNLNGNASGTEEFYAHSSSIVTAVGERMVKILDGRYKKSDIKDSIPSHLDPLQGNILHFLPLKYEAIFEGALGIMPGAPCIIPIRQDAKPFESRPFNIHVHVTTIKTEIKRLIKIAVITSDVDSPWASPCFIIPKKDETV
jgi:hypothetical protein